MSAETTSTFYDKQYGMENLLTKYAITLEYGDVIYRVDALSKTARLIKNISKYTPYMYEGWEVLTTICYEFYKNTTTVHIVLFYNGVHRLELYPGMILRLPDLSLLNQRLSTNIKVNNIGKTILI